MRKIDKIIIHCSDSPDSREIGFKEIDQWHFERSKTEPWSPAKGLHGEEIWCGYHFVVRRTGLVEQGRPTSEPGIHCKGHNKNSIGIVWVGRNEIKQVQKESLLTATVMMLMRYGLDPKNVFGHCELFKGKTCPNLDMNKFREHLEFLITKGAS